VDGIDEGILAHAGREDGLGVLRAELVRPERDLLQEAECCAQGLVDRRRAPVTPDRLPYGLAECVRRDRAV